MNLKCLQFCTEVPASHPERNVHETDQRRHFDQQANYPNEGLVGVQAENSDRDSIMRT
jgi:hypothetical protein